MSLTVSLNRTSGGGVYQSKVLRGFILAVLVSLSCAASALAAGGDLDPAFNVGAGASDAPFDMVLQPDGKVIVVGAFTGFDHTPRKYIARLNADGSLDTSFDPVASSTVFSVALQPDGKILIGGAFATVGGVKRGQSAHPEGEAQLTLTRQALIDGLADGTLTRAQVLRAVVQSSEVNAAEYRGAFVAMQYYSYLRRTPEQSGYEAWLRVINEDPNNVRIMINGFMNSTEYRLRFGQP